MRTIIPIMRFKRNGDLSLLLFQLSAAAASIRLERMFSGLGNESPSARKIMLQCLCMQKTGWTEAPTDVLCVFQHGSVAESSLLGLTRSSCALRFLQYLIFSNILC